MQPCFFALSGVLPRDGRSRAIKECDREDLRQARRGGRRAQRRGGRRARSSLHEVDGARPADRDARLAGRPCPATPPTSCSDVTARDDRRRGRPAAGQRASVDGTFPTGTARYEKRSLADRDPGLGPATLHRLRQVRDRLPARRDPHEGLPRRRRSPARPGASASRTSARPRPARDRADDPGRARRLHRLRHLRRGLPGPEQGRGRSTRPINLAPQPTTCDVERERFDFFLAIPEIDRTLRRAGHRQGLAAAAAAVRVLGRLRGLRRDAVPQAAHPAVRRPAARRQRHRLLVDLRRQPADHAVDDERRRARPGLVELAVRGQRRVRPRHAARRSTAPGRARQLLERARGRARRRPGRRARSTPTRPRRGRHRRAARARRASCAGRLAGDRPRRRRGDLRSARRRRWCRSSVWIVGGDGWAYDIGFGGLDHVLAAGANVNVLVLDTEVYSNTGGQASKATPRGAVAKFAAGGKPTAQEGPGPDRHRLRQRLRRAGRAGRRQRRRRSRPSPRPRRWRRAVAHHRLQPLHRPRHRHGEGHGPAEATPSTAGYWPLCRYDPRHAGPGEHPFQLDSRRAEDPARRVHRQRDALRDARPLRPRGGRAPAALCPGATSTSAGLLRAAARGRARATTSPTTPRPRRSRR